jgi:hypothetical protein
MIFLTIKDHIEISMDLGMIKNKLDKGSNTTTQKSDKNSNSYVVSLRISFKREERKIKIDSNQHKSSLLSK